MTDALVNSSEDKSLDDDSSCYSDDSDDTHLDEHTNSNIVKSLGLNDKIRLKDLPEISRLNIFNLSSGWHQFQTNSRGEIGDTYHIRSPELAPSSKSHCSYKIWCTKLQEKNEFLCVDWKDWEYEKNFVKIFIDKRAIEMNHVVVNIYRSIINIGGDNKGSGIPVGIVLYNKSVRKYRSPSITKDSIILVLCDNGRLIKFVSSKEDYDEQIGWVIERETLLGNNEISDARFCDLIVDSKTDQWFALGGDCVVTGTVSTFSSINYINCDSGNITCATVINVEDALTDESILLIGFSDGTIRFVIPKVIVNGKPFVSNKFSNTFETSCVLVNSLSGNQYLATYRNSNGIIEFSKQEIEIELLSGIISFSDSSVPDTESFDS